MIDANSIKGTLRVVIMMGISLEIKSTLARTTIKATMGLCTLLAV